MSNYQKHARALARWPSGSERHHRQQSVVGLIPHQATYLGCRFNPWSGHAREANDQCFSPPPTTPPKSILKNQQHVLR